MNVNIISSIENNLLQRKEIKAEITFKGATPNRTDLRQALCGKVGANPDLVVLREIDTTYGKQSVTVLAHSYSSKEKLDEIEPVYVRKRYNMVQAEVKEGS